jgi:hypothetical protein
MWARNPKNIKAIPGSREGGQGVYILFDGSMPVYVGKGNIRQRITSHQTKGWGQLWDRFSWYVLADSEMMHDTEVLLLKMLPQFLRSLNKQGGGFRKAKRVGQEDDVAVAITRKRKKSH